MTNTERYCRAICRFQEARDDAQADYQKRLDELKKHDGSEYFREESAKAQAAMNARIAEAKTDCVESVNLALQAMNRALEKRHIPAPTQEHLNILQTLKMRSSLTQAELDDAARAMDGNPYALGVLSDLARENGCLRVYTSLATHYPQDAARRAINSLARGAERVMRSDRARGAEFESAYHQAHYGGPACELPKAPTLKTDAEILGMGVASDDISRFCEAVNEQ